MTAAPVAQLDRASASGADTKTPAISYGARDISHDPAHAGGVLSLSESPQKSLGFHTSFFAVRHALRHLEVRMLSRLLRYLLPHAWSPTIRRLNRLTRGY
jgi:hypothetical protein